MNAFEMEKVNAYIYIFTINKILVCGLILSVCVIGYEGTMACDWFLELIIEGKETSYFMASETFFFTFWHLWNRNAFYKVLKRLSHILIDKDISFLLTLKIGMNQAIQGTLESMKYSNILRSAQ